MCKNLHRPKKNLHEPRSWARDKYEVWTSLIELSWTAKKCFVTFFSPSPPIRRKKLPWLCSFSDVLYFFSLIWKNWGIKNWRISSWFAKTLYCARCFLITDCGAILYNHIVSVAKCNIGSDILLIHLFPFGNYLYKSLPPLKYSE